MKSGRKTRVTLLGGIALLSSLLICQGAYAKTQITFAFKALAGAETEVFKSLISDFEKKNPSIKVKPINLIASGGSWIERLLTMMAGGQTLDVMNMEYQFAVPLMLKRLVLPLDDLIKSDRSFDLKAYAKSSVEAFTYKGKHYGIPYTAQTHNMFINREALSKAGLAFPKNDWTINDLTEVAKRTTRDKNGDKKPDFYGLTFDVSSTRTPNLVYSFGARLTTANREKCTLTSAESVKGYKWLEDIVNGQKLAAYSSGQSKFETNGTAMYTSGPWIISQLRDRCKFPWDILPYPKGPGGQGATLGADAFIISASSKNRKASWELVKFFTSAESLKKLASVGASLPSRNASRKDMLSGVKVPTNVETYEIGIENAIESPVTSAWNKVSEIYSNMINDMLSRKKSVEQALSQASGLINTQLAKDLKQ